MRVVALSVALIDFLVSLCICQPRFLCLKFGSCVALASKGAVSGHHILAAMQDAAQEAGRAAAVSAALEAGRVAGANESIPVDLSTVRNRTEAEGDAKLPLDPNWGTGASKGKAGAASDASGGASATAGAHTALAWSLSVQPVRPLAAACGSVHGAGRHAECPWRLRSGAKGGS